jgi:hypothetical protein
MFFLLQFLYLQSVVQGNPKFLFHIPKVCEFVFRQYLLIQEPIYECNHQAGQILHFVVPD